MLRSKFLWRLYASFATMALVLALSIGIPLSQRMTEQTVFQIEHRLLAVAESCRDLTDLALRRDPATLQPTLDDLGQRIGIRVTVIAADGTVIADSEHNPSTMDNHGRRPEVSAASQGSPGVSRRFSNTLQQEMLYLALPSSGGFVRTAVPLEQLDDDLAALRVQILVATGAASALALGLAFLLARRLTRPLHEVTDAAKAVADGNYEERVPVSSDDEIGQLAGAFNLASARVQSQLESLDSERNTLAAILASMVEGVIAVDEQQRIVHISKVAGRLLGADPGPDSLGRPVSEITHLRAVREVLTAAFESSQEASRIAELPGPEETRTLDLRASPLRGAGETRGAVLVIQDLTRLYRLEAVRRDFVANVSHELKTPLTVIRGLIETLVEDPDTDAETRQRFLQKVHSQSQRLSALVGDLLSLSRLESENNALELVPIDLRAPLVETVRALRPSAEAKELSLEIEYPDDRPLVVRGDEAGIRQVLGNLLDNAIKYSRPGGRVWVRLFSQGDEITFEVEDTGIGIASRHQSRIFERFYRVDKARSRELGGTGLGLAIVKNVARSMGGEVSVESAPARGSIFTVRLPALEAGGRREIAANA